MPESVNNTATSPSNNKNVSQNEALRYVKGTKVKLGREISTRLFADYSFKVDEYENQVDLKHQLELAYRVHKNLYIRATSELDTEQSWGVLQTVVPFWKINGVLACPKEEKRAT